QRDGDAPVLDRGGVVARRRLVGAPEEDLGVTLIRPVGDGIEEHQGLVGRGRHEDLSQKRAARSGERPRLANGRTGGRAPRREPLRSKLVCWCASWRRPAPGMSRMVPHPMATSRAPKKKKARAGKLLHGAYRTFIAGARRAVNPSAPGSLQIFGATHTRAPAEPCRQYEFAGDAPQPLFTLARRTRVFTSSARLWLVDVG